MKSKYTYYIIVRDCLYSDEIINTQTAQIFMDASLNLKGCGYESMELLWNRLHLHRGRGWSRFCVIMATGDTVINFLSLSKYKI